MKKQIKALAMLRNKRGLTIESVLCAMLVLFGFCTLLTYTAILMKNVGDAKAKHADEQVTVAQIAEDGVYAVRQNKVSSFASRDKAYTATLAKEGGRYTLEIRKADADTVIAVYVIEGSGNIISRTIS